MSKQTSVPGRRRLCRAGGLRALWAVACLLGASALPIQAAAAAVPSGQAGLVGSSDADRSDPGLRAQTDGGLSMDEAVDLAQRRYNARVVRAEVSERGGRRVYLLRLLSADGRVFNVRIDAASGSFQ